MDLPQNEYLSYCIANYLATYYGYDYYGAIEWLNISSDLESVIITPNKFDDSLLYCGSAWDYEKSWCNLQSELNTELVRFHFAWGALESLIEDFVSAKKIDRYGKINALCEHLKASNAAKLLPVCYLNEYEHLVSLLRDTGAYQKELKKLGLYTETRYGFKGHVDIAGIGIYVTYRVRNKFAHGAMRFPEPEEYSGEYPCEIELIEVATRIVLMTILMLLISDTKGHDFFLDYTEDNLKYSALRYLQNLCTLQSEIFADQLVLPEFIEE